MFYNCQNVKEINLTNFYTSLVTNMNGMFYGCNNLIYIDLSNFDMNNCNNYENMFTNVNNIRFINLQYFKNDKIIRELFKEAKNITVCQNEKIITNPKVYYCCDYNFQTDKCKIIPTTIVITIPTTDSIEPSISDSNKIFPSSMITTYLDSEINNNIEKITTDKLAIIDTTDLSSEEVKTTINKEPKTSFAKIETTQPTIYKLDITSTIEKSENIKTQNIFSSMVEEIEHMTAATSVINNKESEKETTGYSTSVLTTIMNKATEKIIQPTITEIINGSKLYYLVVIGYSHFQIAGKKVTFYIYFVCLNG